MHFSRRHAKDTHSSPYCRQRLLSRPEHCKLETGQQPQAQAPGGFCLVWVFVSWKREVVRRLVWVRNPKEQESELKQSRRNGTQRAWKTLDNQNLNFLTPSPLSHWTWHFPNLLPKRDGLQQSLMKDYVDPPCRQIFHFLGMRPIFLGKGDAFLGRAGPAQATNWEVLKAWNWQRQVREQWCCYSLDRRMDLHPHNGTPLSTKGMNKRGTLATIWMNLKIILLIARSQAPSPHPQKYTLHDSIHIKV